MTTTEWTRTDLGEQAAAHYAKRGEVPALAEGDIIEGLPDNPGRHVVADFAAGGMLVEVIRMSDGTPLSFPRFYAPMHDDGFFLTAADE